MQLIPSGIKLTRLVPFTFSANYRKLSCHLFNFSKIVLSIILLCSTYNQMVDSIERAAENAYLTGEKYLNPYTLNSHEFNCYERGWTQAVKKSDLGLLPKPVVKYEKTFSLNYPKERESAYRTPSDPDSAEAYRNRKG
ncbi:MAG TPA: hypothetical protein VES38_02950 [Methylotenera sp.]|nr:hypothetical protein [Methylotenera sp.]